MKRILILFIVGIVGVLGMLSQVIKFNTTSFSIRERGYYGWTEFSKPKSSDMLVTVDLSLDLVTIYSPQIQVLKVVDSLGEGYDSDGDYVIKFGFIDNEGVNGLLRLIQRRGSGKREMYIGYSNVEWVYSLVLLQ